MFPNVRTKGEVDLTFKNSIPACKFRLKLLSLHHINLTMNKYIVMGANTYASLPKRLEGRKYIVLSKHLKEIESGLVFNNFEV